MLLSVTRGKPFPPWYASPSADCSAGIGVPLIAPLQHLAEKLDHYASEMDNAYSEEPWTLSSAVGSRARSHGSISLQPAVEELSDEAIDTIVVHAAKIGSPFTLLVILPHGGAISDVKEDETAIGGRDAAYGVHAISMWENPAESETHIAWTREFMQEMEPFTIPGVSLNFTSDQSEEKVKASFGSEKYERLVALKNEYDPTNLFRLNQNIKPTAQTGVVS